MAHVPPGQGRLHGVQDRYEIESLILRYADLIDAGDFAGVGRLFTHGAIALGDGTVIAAGADAVEQLYASTTRRYPDDGTPHSAHLVSNLLVHVADDGRSASADSRFLVVQALPDLPLQPIATGRYHDTFERTDDGWRWAQRVMTPTMFGDVSQHLLIDTPDASADPASG